MAKDNAPDLFDDIEKRVIGIGGMLHADAETMLLEQGSRQDDLWGANVHTFKEPEKRIEYEALINIRPGQNNPGMMIQNEKIRSRMKTLIEKLVISPDEKLV